jgi:hypothetical protein
MLEAPPTILHTLFQALVVLVLIALAGVSFFRLRATPSGLLIGASIVLRLLGMLVMRIAGSLFMGEWGMYQWIGYRAITGALGNALCGLLLIVGLVLLPMSLRKLAR